MEANSKLNWQQLIDEALTAPGNLGGVYNRFHDYSIGNMVLLMMQGVHEPVASASRWKQLGRTVTNWRERKEILVPRFSKEPPPEPAEGEPIEEKRERVAHLIGFVLVKGVFPLSATDGPELPPAPTPGWDLQQALGKLGIREVPFERPDGNVQGYARGLDIAINPVAVRPTKTRFHEIAHVVLGHTIPRFLNEYMFHRGIKEFEAESTAYLCMNEVGQLDEETASVSRGYIQTWLENEHPDDKSIQRVFRAADGILRAGRVDPNFDPNAGDI